MKANRATLLFVPILLLLCGCAPLAFAGDDLDEQLKSDYQGKILTLRHFYKGENLSFSSDGSLLGDADVGPWTVDAQVLVKSIQLGDRGLEIRGRRVCLVFDSNGKRHRDVLDSLAESGLKDREKLEQAFREKEVEIEIGFASDKPDAEEISTAMNAVFLKPEEPIEDIVPEFWRSYFDGLNGQPQSAAHPSETVYRVRPGEASAPRQTYAPEPPFSEEARQAKYHGTVIVSLVVDPTGAPKDVRIVSPLGMGLDENAVGAVHSWKFQPAMKDGKPVSVQLMVEVDFRLY
jgi:TonB family protein